MDNKKDFDKEIDEWLKQNEVPNQTYDELVEEIKAKKSITIFWYNDIYRKNIRYFSVGFIIALILLFLFRTFWLVDIQQETSVLSNNEKITFFYDENNTSSITISDNLKERSLTDREIKDIFGELGFVGSGLFDTSNNKLCGLKGTIGKVNIIVSESDKINVKIPNIAQKNKNTYTINGQNIKGWYKKNNQSESVTYLYCASVELNGILVYLEQYADNLFEDSVHVAIGELILQLTKLKQFDFSQIEY